jgi:indolepyruvate ferredoxin oxidoreductase beta subunit
MQKYMCNNKNTDNCDCDNSKDFKTISSSLTYKPPYNIYICGVGGQGIIKTSIVIGEAAIFEQKKVAMSEIHGMAQRGGVVSTELKIGDSKSSIIPEGETDLLLAFEPLEALRASPKANKNTAIIFNTSSIMPSNISASKFRYPDLDDITSNLKFISDNVFALDAESMAREAGHVLSLNMVMLGAATAVFKFPIDKKSILASMRNNLPEKSISINMNAFESGFRFVKSSNGVK